jgi:hypothetical protein
MYAWAGEAAYELLMEARPDNQAELTLNETGPYCATSETRGIKNKTILLAAVLQRATALEAKYLVKLLVTT